MAFLGKDDLEEEEEYWGRKPAANPFSFDDDDCEILSIEKTELEKEKILRAISPTKPVTVAPPTFNSVLSNIFVKRSPHQPQAGDFRGEKLETKLPLFNGNVETAVRRLVLGMPVTLEQFKTLNEKLELLDESLRWHDGNAIFTVVCFLKRSLKSKIFNQEIMGRPDALNHYLKLLAERSENAQLADVLTMLGRNEDAAIVLYKNLISPNSSAESKLQNLRKYHSNHLKMNPELNFLDRMVDEQIKLFEHQLCIEESDKKQEQEKKNLIFLEFPRPTLPGKSVISTLHYCCLYHYYLPENNLGSPAHMRKMFSIGERQFTWVALQALVKNKLWKDVESLFQTRSWMKGTKMSSCIGFDKVVKALYEVDAPTDEVSKYLNALDSEVRLQLAKKYKYNKIVVDTYVAQRDRLGLQTFYGSLVPNSRDQLYALESLRASSLKWKN